MLKGLVSAGTKALGGHRFGFVNILPVALLAVLVIGLVRSGAYDFGARPSLSRVVPEGKSAIVTSAGLVLVTFLVAVLLQPFQVAIVRLLEGYWRRRGLLGAFGDLLRQQQLRKKIVAEYDRGVTAVRRPTTPVAKDMADYARRRRRALATAARAGETLSTYPEHNDRVLPTRLGNILRSGEDAAGQRYGLDAMTAYPRMYPFVNDRLNTAMSQQLDTIDFMSALCVALGLGTFAAAPLVSRVDRWSFVPVALALLAVAAYQAAKAAAREHGVLLASIIDLHRTDLVRHLNYPLAVECRRRVPTLRRAVSIPGRPDARTTSIQRKNPSLSLP